MTSFNPKYVLQSQARTLLCVFLFCSFAQAALPVTIATTDIVHAFTGSRDVKFLFISISDSNVYFVDYSEADPSLKVLEGMKGAHLVDISPDGKWLTYQTGGGIEGPCLNACTTSLWIRPFTAAGSPVKIARNGYVPRFVVSALDTPTIIYSTSVDCPRDSFPPLIRRSEQLCFKTGMVLSTKTLGGTVIEGVDTLFSGGSYYGGISYDGRYLSTGWPGGVNTFMLDLTNTSNGPQLMHSVPTINSDGVTSYSNIGACNMSRSPSRIFTNTMLYYDLGLSNPDISNPLWGNWDAHSLLFIAGMGTSRGEPLRCYGLPPDQVAVEPSPAVIGRCVKTEWIHPEWSNHPYFAVASLQVERLWMRGSVYTRSNKREAAYAINLKDRNVIRLVSTTDTGATATFSVVTPALWVKVPSDFTEDPTWLSAPDPDKSVPVTTFLPRRTGTGHVLLTNRTIVSDKPLLDVSIFSASGALIWRKAMHRDKSASTIVRLPGMRPGLYVVSTRSSAGTRALRWVVK